MASLPVDYIELGFRSLDDRGFRGAFAYTTDNFIRLLQVPAGLKLGVMVNASELVAHPAGVVEALSLLFNPADESPVDLVRIACHMPEVAEALPGCAWLKEQGYTVTLNLMQISERSELELEDVAGQASEYPLDVLYFADSLGSMNPDRIAEIMAKLRAGWGNAIGVHAHDNMGLSLANCTRAIVEGATWVDGTVNGMGRGAGNTRTEYLATELADLTGRSVNISPLLSTIATRFDPMQSIYGWGTNTYYYLAGKFGIHPTFIQEMLSDPRFDEVDLLAVIDHLRETGGNRYSLASLESGLHFFRGEPRGSWSPATLLSGREVLILGTGPGATRHRKALEEYIRLACPEVIALNTQSAINGDLIDLRVASHPVRLLEDCPQHLGLPQPLITPASMLPDKVKSALGDKELLDFGFLVEPDTFEFNETHCVLPSSLVIAYALAIASSGRASRILMAGFDGYASDDPRTIEMNRLLAAYVDAPDALPLLSITPSSYDLPASSVYSILASVQSKPSPENV